MPSRYLIICPLADQAGVETDTGFHTDTPLYTTSDPTPRTQTHGWTSTAYTPTQDAAVQAAAPNYPNSVFEKYNVPQQATYPQTRLGQLGLTTSAT